MGVWERWEHWEHWEHVHGSPRAAACGCLLGISVWAADKKELRLPPRPNSPGGSCVTGWNGEA